MEYNKLLEKYQNDYYQIYSSTDKKSPNFENKELAELYLQKYYLNEKEYNDCWNSIQQSVFIVNHEFPQMIFNKNFKIVASIGGILFDKKDFEKLQECIKKLGDRYIIIIQKSYEENSQEAIFRMKFPIEISWEEMMSGSYISTVLFEMFGNEYYMFSESGSWGRYSANEYELPLDILGYKSNISNVFDGYSNSDDVITVLPNDYKNMLK